MNIYVYDEVCGDETYSAVDMAAIASERIALDERVPGGAGTAFELKSWYRAWRSMRATLTEQEPSHMTVEAVDEFQADIPWDQLDQAVFLYELDGQPIKKGFPLRLYVPDGSSECLNVKSVVTIRFHYDPASAEASYGFKNLVGIDDLKLKFKK